MNIDLKKIKNIYMTGIKGAGMTALAELLVSMDKNVSGSDVAERFFTDEILEELKVKVNIDFNSLNINESIDWLINSAAYGDENPEIAKAKELNIPISNYTEALGFISKDRFTITVAGTHGKTTTTAMIGITLMGFDSKATIIVGSAVPNFNGHNCFVGNNNVFVAEACEYRRHFLNFHPNIVLITNIDEDHLDYYKDIEDIKNAFYELCNKLPSNGKVIYNSDDSNSVKLIEKVKKNRKDIECISFGMSEKADYLGKITKLKDGISEFKVIERNKSEYDAKLSIPGNHNISNAIASIATVKNIPDYCIINTSKIIENLFTFRGTKRRFEFKGEVEKIKIFDDYGHHPKEIRVTLNAFRNYFHGYKIWCVFQPHTYTRTRALWNDFLDAFSDADNVIINDIFSSAREVNDGRTNSKDLAEQINNRGTVAYYIGSYEDTTNFLLNNISTPSILITMGAGNNYRIGEEFIKRFAK